MDNSELSSMRRHRSDLLDWIRTVAITMVVFFHVAVAYPGDGRGTLEWVFRANGAAGVDLFFPLSGFLITSFLLSSRRPDFVRVFFLRRAFRILPLYVAAVTLAMAGMYVTGIDIHLLDRFWINYTFLTAWFIHFQGPGSVPYTITWSLSVEEFAYVIFGLLAWWDRRRLPLWLLAFSVLPVGLKYAMLAGGSEGYYFLPPARIDSIAIGGLAAWLMLNVRHPLLWLGAGLAGALALSRLDPMLDYALRYNLLSLATCMVIVAIQTWLGGVGNRATSLLASIGFYSYFTYLFHIFVVEGMFLAWDRLALPLPPFLAMAVACLAITHAAAMISYRLFEGPLIRYGRQLETRWQQPRPARPPADPATPPNPGRF